MAAPRQGLPVRLERAPHRGAAETTNPFQGAQIAPSRVGFAAQNFLPDRVLQRKIFFPLKLFFTFLIFLANGKEVLGGFHDNG
jgi:hypothetical protein